MNFVRLVILLSSFIIFPVGLIFLIHHFLFTLIISLLTAFLVILIIFYGDKIILYALKGRELFEASNEGIYQVLKKESYEKLEKTPKLYVYDGSGPNLFVLESRKEITFVLERKFLSRCSTSEVSEFIHLFMDIKNDGGYGLETTGIALGSILLAFIYKISSYFSFNSKFWEQIITLFFIINLKPFLSLISFLSCYKKTYQVTPVLEGKLLNINEGRYITSIPEFISLHFQSKTKEMNFLIEYIETYSSSKNLFYGRSSHVS